MTTATVRAAVFDISSGDLDYLSEVSLTVFSEDGKLDFDYLFGTFGFDFRVRQSGFTQDVFDFGPGFQSDEANLLRLEFGSSFATFLTFTDIDAGLEYLIELDSQGSGYIGFPTSQRGFQGILDRVTGVDHASSGTSGDFSIRLSELSGANATEDDFLDLSDEGSSDNLSFGVGDDTFYSGSGVDVADGGDGDDRMVANDNGIAGFSSATFFGGGDNDVLKVKGAVIADFDGGNGADKLTGGSLNDRLDGGAGRDVLVGLSGDDELIGGAQDDQLFGGRDNDTLNGGAGVDKLRGNLGSDQMFGGFGDDDLRGGGQNDTLWGQDGNDYLLGENGRDIVNGGAGNDVLIGGFGAGLGDGQRDVFVFIPEGGYDSIRDFENGIDKIDLTFFEFTDFETDVLSRTTETATGLKLRVEAGTVLYVNGLTLDDFDRADVYLEVSDVL